MADNEKNQGKVLHDDLEANQEDHEQERVVSDLDEQQDVNQGMSTGTHSTTKSGVNWPASYRGKAASSQKKTP